MTWEKLLLTAWEFPPSIVIGCALLLGLYFWSVKFKFDRKGAVFASGVLTIFLALVSPIDALGDNYLFSAHMVQHMMLGMVAPVLLVAGMHEGQVRCILKVPFLASLERVFGHPAVTMIVANFTFWVWHLPYLYNLTLENEQVHIAEHMLFMITGVMLWWPIFKPIAEGRLLAMPAVVYMFMAAAISTTLGIIFTMADTPYYACYANPHDEIEGTLKLIREDWGLSQLDDQKMGGAIMWEPAGAVFLWAIMVVTLDWLKEESEVHQVKTVKQEIKNKVVEGSSESV